jgi:hypothetical protein
MIMRYRKAKGGFGLRMPRTVAMPVREFNGIGKQPALRKWQL